MSSVVERSGTERRRALRRGAVAAVLLCAGSVLTASAGTRFDAGPVGPAGASVLVPMTPCRLLDTRSGMDHVGVRTGAIGATETIEVRARGTNGNCTVSAAATAVALNVTIIGPTAASFLTVFPAGQDLPLAANLNWVAGQAPTANAVTVRLSAGGAFDLYNHAGQVDVVVDVVGYYEPAGTASRIVQVAESGAVFTTLSAALASITDNDATHPYVVRLAPGTYVEPASVRLKDHVDVEGSGSGVTTIVCTCRSSDDISVGGAGAVMALDTGQVTVSGLSIVNRASDAAGGAPDTAAGIWARNGTLVLRHVVLAVAGSAGGTTIGVAAFGGRLTLDGSTVIAGGEGPDTGLSASSVDLAMTESIVAASGPVSTTGVLLSSSTFTMDRVTAAASTRHPGETHSPNNSTAIDVVSSWGTMREVTASATGGDSATAVLNDHSSPRMDDVTATAHSDRSATAVSNDHSSPVIDDLTAVAQGTGAWTMHGEIRTIGIYDAFSSPTITESTITATGTGASYIYGVYGDSSTATIGGSMISGTSISIHNAGAGTTTVWNSVLSGTPTGSGYVCASDAIVATLSVVVCPA